jgi:quinol monooxygenase YgiN
MDQQPRLVQGDQTMKWSRLLISTACAVSATLAFAQPREAPVVRLFELSIAPGQTAAFDAAGRANIGTSVQQEPGTLAMFAVTQQDRPLLAHVLEVYQNPAAFQAHAESAHFKQFLADTQHVVTTKKLIELEPQFLGDKPAPLAVAPGSAAPLARIARITVHDKDLADYRRIVLWEMQQAMDLEPGVLAMYAATVKGQPQQWVFFEVYADQAAYDTHRATPHFRAYLAQTQPMIAERALIDTRPSSLMNKGGLAYQATAPVTPE